MLLRKKVTLLVSRSMNKPVVVLGAGGHASVLVESLKQQNRQILALIAPQCCGSRLVFDGIPVWKDDTPLLAFSPENIELVNGIGSLPGSNLRATLFSHYRQAGYRFMTVISTRAYVSEYAVLAEGVQVMAGAIIQTGAQVGIIRLLIVEQSLNTIVQLVRIVI
ncbi:hypothetical protein PCI56_11085 [Plesiomonas shigelloides subsp. oncorhynchi]|nr:hypothetical protein [Plesiomonas shigelloides]